MAALCGGGGSGFLPNGNVIRQNLSFYEWYGNGSYTVNDNFNFGGSIWYSPSVLNSGAFGVYYAGNVTFICTVDLADERHRRFALG
jgi:hypothetical protein